MDSKSIKILEIVKSAKNHEENGRKQEASELYQSALVPISQDVGKYFTESQEYYFNYDSAKGAKKRILKAHQKITHFFQLIGKIIEIDGNYDSLQKALQAFIVFIPAFEQIIQFNNDYLSDVSYSKLFFAPFSLPSIIISDLLFKAEEIHTKNNNPKAALECLDAISEFDSEQLVLVLERKGIIQDTCGNLELAKEVFMHILSIDPQNKIAKTKIESYKNR
jgi:tetratricopeptide (TPR) repeat protein